MKRAGLLLTLGVAALAAAAGAQEARPRTRVMSCTASGCHASELDHKALHGPTAVSACDACHDYTDPTLHTFRLKRSGADLCTFCHIDHTGTEGPFVHAPMAEGKCLSCHDPHGAPTRELMRAGTVNDACLSCHVFTLEGAHKHQPAAERCTNCHLPHTSQFPGLLPSASRDLCASCHENVLTSLATLAHPHPPAQDDCLTCHTPHASDAIKILKQPPQELCISCHADVGQAISAATHPHSVVTNDKACLNCHSAHASDHASQLLQTTVATCLECHQKPIVVSESKTVDGVPELAAPGMHLHGPAAEGKCAECHTVHGGGVESLLIEPYPASFYLTYSEDAYALCLKCHDAASIEVDGPNAITGFRDGNRNLHTVHVAASPQGRSCRACHAVHASRNETMLADTVAFGQWQLPINWTPTPTGGSCASGCHEIRSYDRQKDAPPILTSPPAAEESPAPEPPADPTEGGSPDARR